MAGDGRTDGQEDTLMRFWFKRADKDDRAHTQKKRHKNQRPGPRRRTGPPDDDPIKNWETQDQAFLRQAGDPFDG
jgi:hypothetical protein